MSVLTAARTILDEAQEPLPAEAIYRQMAERGLWCNPHDHPETTVAQAIASEIGKHGRDAVFRRVGSRAFALRSSAYR